MLQRVICILLALGILCSIPARSASFLNHSPDSAAGNDAAGPSSGWKMGVALYSFRLFSFEEAVKKAGSADIRYAEGFSFHKLGGTFGNVPVHELPDEGIRKMKTLLKSNKVRMPSMYVGNGKNAQEWDAYFKVARELGMEYLVCEPQPKDWDLLDSLAGRYRIKIAIHQHAKGESRYWHPDSVLAALKGHAHFGVCADVGHWVRTGLDPVECLRALEGKLLGVHLKDVAESGNLKAKNKVVGQGIIDFKAVAAELKRQNFKGMIYVEREDNWENNLPDVVEAIRYFEALR